MDMWATAWHMTNHSLSSRQAAASKCPSNRQLLAASILNPLSFSVCFSGGLRIGTARKLTSKTSELLSAESQDKHIFFLYWNDMSWDSWYSRYKFIWAITWMDNGFPTFKPRTFFLLIGLNVETVKRIHPWSTPLHLSFSCLWEAGAAITSPSTRQTADLFLNRFDEKERKCTENRQV